MESINHFTVNTKHNRQIFKGEVAENLYDDLRQVTLDAQTEKGADIFDDTVFSLTVEENCYLGTLSVKTKTGLVPVLITAGASTEHSRIKMWEEMLSLSKEVLRVEQKETVIFPSAPIIMDLITPFAGNHMDIMEWTGDFSRCMGWILLSEYRLI